MPFYGAVLGALVQVTCPRCRSVQLRARRPPRERFTCRSCGQVFTLAEGHARAPHVRDRA